VDGAVNTVDVTLGGVDDPGVSELLETHLAHMRAITPPEFVFAFDAGGLAAPHVMFFTARVGDELVGCGALAQLDDERGEIKSMHVREAVRGRGIAGILLTRIESHAGSLGLRSLWLETGVTDHFAAAQALYRAHGYVSCGPFGSYTDNGHSAFFTKRLDGELL
jgi:putative acetyltransferase